MGKKILQDRKDLEKLLRLKEDLFGMQFSNTANRDGRHSRWPKFSALKSIAIDLKEENRVLKAMIAMGLFVIYFELACGATKKRWRGLWLGSGRWCRAAVRVNKRGDGGGVYLMEGTKTSINGGDSEDQDFWDGLWGEGGQSMWQFRRQRRKMWQRKCK